MADSGLLSVLLPLLPPSVPPEDYDNIKAILLAIQQLHNTFDGYLTDTEGSDMLLPSIMSARFVAAEPIAEGMMVTLNSSGQLIQATYLSCLGVADSSGDTGALLTVIFEGKVTYPSWNLVTGNRYYVGTDGFPSNAGADHHFRVGGADEIVLGVPAHIESFYLGVALDTKTLMLCPKFLPFAVGQ